MTSGTTSEILLNQLNDEKYENAHYQREDHGDSFRTLESAVRFAFMMDDALAGERAKAKKTGYLGNRWQTAN